jgi:hypothetical protein
MYIIFSRWRYPIHNSQVWPPSLTWLSRKKVQHLDCESPTYSPRDGTSWELEPIFVSNFPIIHILTQTKGKFQCSTLFRSIQRGRQIGSHGLALGTKRHNGALKFLQNLHVPLLFVLPSFLDIGFIVFCEKIQRCMARLCDLLRNIGVNLIRRDMMPRFLYFFSSLSSINYQY